MSNGQAQPIQKFLNRPITFESNRNSRFEFESNLEASQVPSFCDSDLADFIYDTSMLHISKWHGITDVWIQDVILAKKMGLGSTSDAQSKVQSRALNESVPYWKMNKCAKLQLRLP